MLDHVKHVYNKKATSFVQASFYPVEYMDGGRMSTKSETQRHEQRPKKGKKDNGGKKVFSSDDIEY